MTRHRRNPPTPKPDTEVADSLKQAAAILKVPIAVLQKLKAAGCPGFRNGRVHLDEVRQWLADPKNMEVTQGDPEDIDSAKVAVLRQRARLLKIRADAEEGLLVRVDEVKRLFVRMVHAAKTKFLRIPRRVALRLASESDWQTIEEVLDNEIYDGLEELHNHDWNQHQGCEHCGCLAASSTPTEPPTVEAVNPSKVSTK